MSERQILLNYLGLVCTTGTAISVFVCGEPWYLAPFHLASALLFALSLRIAVLRRRRSWGQDW